MEKGGVVGVPDGITEMDDAAVGLAYGNELLYYQAWWPPGWSLLTQSSVLALFDKVWSY